MIGCVLDASAVVALLRNEPGANLVAARLTGSVVSVVNLAEVVTLFARGGIAEPSIRAALDPLPILRIPMDEDDAFAAGMLQPLTRTAGLSLGDRVCLALARRLAVPALTADAAWLGIAAAVGVDVISIR
jgi:PIN domain nuclease of toxin-antitoxin system